MEDSKGIGWPAMESGEESLRGPARDAVTWQRKRGQ